MYPAGVAGIAARRVQIGNGLALRVLESGPLHGHLVVLVHGWGGSVYSYDATIPALASAGHRVVAIDLPGHGLSDTPDDAFPWSIPALADAVLGVVATIGAARYSIVAHSMGGAVSLEIAGRGDARLERLALLGAVGLGRVPLAPVLRLLTPAWARHFIAPLLTRTVVHLILELSFATTERPEARDVDEYWAPTQFDGYALSCREVLHRVAWGRLSRATLRALRLPVLVVAGGRDLVVREVAVGGRLIPGARVVEIPDAGHLAVQERAEIVNRELLAFFAR